jgi:hypothetical protein
MAVEEYNTQDALVLACAAHRVNKGYLKENNPILTDDQKVVCTQYANRNIVLFNLRAPTVLEHAIAPLAIKVIDRDREMADEIRKFFRRLVFTAVKNDDEFWTQMNAILINETVSGNRMGFVACLPSMYLREYAKHQFARKIADLSPEYLAPVGTEILDLDCEIIQINRSKNYDAWNVCAIIENKMVSWMTNKDLQVGPCVVIKAKVKQHGSHWKYQSHETRLNYVKAFQ